MERRSFLAGSGCLLLSAHSETQAQSSPTQGCRGFSGEVGRGSIVAYCGDFSMRAPAPKSADGLWGPRTIDMSCVSTMLSCGRLFKTQPVVAYIRDEGRKNAYAQYMGGYGAILLGAALITDVVTRTRRKYNPIWGFSDDHIPLEMIMAHEFGHILQFKKGLPDSWKCEPHADYLAGWYLGRRSRREREIVIAAMTMFRFGDWQFNSWSHHGTPHYRARMVRAGYADRELGVDHAFDKGLKVVGLA